MHGHLNVKYVSTVFLVYQVLDFPIKTFVCFWWISIFLRIQPGVIEIHLNYRDTSKLLPLIYHFLYFTIKKVKQSRYRPGVAQRVPVS